MRPDEDEHFAIDRLRDELHQLERRVEALEYRPESRPQPRAETRLETAALTAEGPADAGLDFALPNAIQVAGRAVLGLAGAFLLRALAEAGAVPRLLVVTAAILYAAAWLVFAIRTRARDALAGAAYGITAALIFAPLLWEATVRFDVLPAAAAASVLTGFVALVFALAWPGNPGAIASVTTVSSVLTAIALMVRTGDLVPFAAAVLAIACVIESGVWRGHQKNMRAAVAMAADFAIWLLLYIVTSPTGVAQGYTPVGPATSLALCAFLFPIYSASIAWRAVARRRAITVFEMVQSAIAFGLAAGGALAVTQGRAAASVGALSAIASAACYFTAFTRFPESPRRNHHVFASWGLALSLVACILIMPESLLTPIWSAAAVIATLAGARASQPTLAIHGALFLVATGLISGVPGSILNAFTGSALASATPALSIMAIAAACCYAAWGRTPAKASVVPALLSAVSIGAILILTGVPLIAGRPTPSLLAAARTVVTCALALALRFAGSRTDRRELIWVGYAAIALGVVKLIFEDFRQSHPAALAVSLLCYGAFLILAPMLSRKIVSDLPLKPLAQRHLKAGGSRH
jgi:hypothetical protein